MQGNSTADRQPRRLVVVFQRDLYLLIRGEPLFAYESYLVNSDNSDRPQLVDRISHIGQPSRLVRFATLLGLAIEDKPVIGAVERAYKFITRNYAAGDQVILCVQLSEKWETDRHAKVAEVLARHLNNGTGPASLVNAQPGNGANKTGSRIPIYAVVVDCTLSDRDEIQSISTWSDWLKSRLPPGIRHMVCYSYSSIFRSSSTMYDLDGAIISRELSFSGKDFSLDLGINATKHVLYYKRHWLFNLDKQQPVLTCVLNSSSHQAQGVLPLELVRPAGMYHHEVQRYQDLPCLMPGGSVLVWKSCRKAPDSLATCPPSAVV